MTDPSKYDPGPGQPYGLGNRQDKDAGDQAERAGSVKPKPTQRVRHTGLGNLTPEEHAEAYPLNYELAARDKSDEPNEAESD